MKSLYKEKEVMSRGVPAESVRTVAGVLSWDTEFQILDATEKLRAPNAVCANRMVRRLVSEDIGNEQECESTGGNVNM